MTELERLAAAWEKLANNRREYPNDKAEAIRKRVLLRCVDELREALTEKREWVH